jgi:DNA anti-recombination protein RmuC
MNENETNHHAPHDAAANGRASLAQVAEGQQPGSVDKIRDILFGSQMRDYEKKFTRLEERLLQETADLREDIKRRLASLESFVKSELAALADAHHAEKSERTNAIKSLVGDLEANRTGWEQKIAHSDDRHTKTQHGLRELVLEESKRLGEILDQKHAALSAGQNRESQELRGMLTDRFALADLFSELALRLKHEFKLPSPQDH